MKLKAPSELLMEYCELCDVGRLGLRSGNEGKEKGKEKKKEKKEEEDNKDICKPSMFVLQIFGFGEVPLS